MLADLVQTRIQVLGDAWGLMSFLYVSDDEFTIDEKSAARNLGADAAPVLDAAVAALESTNWTTDAIQQALQEALVDGLELKPRKAFGPVRVVSPGRPSAAVRVHGVAGPGHDPGQAAVSTRKLREIGP